MDIFIIKAQSIDNVGENLLDEFKQKEFKNLKQKNLHCFSYLMVDRILTQVYGIDNRELEFVDGKPFLKTKQKFLSISHTNDYVALAFADNNCSVDIERIVPRNWEKISKRMNFKCNSLDDFYKAWTFYEARYKLGESVNAQNNYIFGDYSITACSVNPSEKFEIYIQN